MSSDFEDYIKNRDPGKKPVHKPINPPFEKPYSEAEVQYLSQLASRIGDSIAPPNMQELVTEIEATFKCDEEDDTD